MRGEVGAVWSETWTAIWQPLIEHEGAKDDLFCELFRSALERGALKLPAEPQIVGPDGDVSTEPNKWLPYLTDPLAALEAFKTLSEADFAGERGAAALLEAAFDVAEEQGEDELSNYYFNLLESFISKFSLRYDLRRPCVLCPTLPGIFSGLIRQLRAVTSLDAHLTTLMNDFETAVRDLKADASDGRIRTCIQRQFNLIEAISRSAPGVTTSTLGQMCDQIGSWPHSDLKEAVKKIYKFGSDYPGIRHGGTPANAIRQIDVRDLVAVTIVLIGFAPYLAHGLNSDDAYRGGRS